MYNLFRGKPEVINDWPENVHRFDEVVDVLRATAEPMRQNAITIEVLKMPLTKEWAEGKPEGSVSSGVWVALQSILENYPGVVQKDGREYRMSPDWDGVHLSERTPAVAKAYATVRSSNGTEKPAKEEPRATNAVSAGAIIPCFGLSWLRDDVHWDTKQPHLYGQESPEAEVLNFADQIGVYILYNWPNIVYVGRTSAQKNGLFSRLFSHHISSRRSDKWDRFSWFGLKGLDGLARADLDIEGEITLMETVLIEALSPPFNDKKGDNLGTHFFQVADPVIQDIERQKVMDMLLATLQQR